MKKILGFVFLLGILCTSLPFAAYAGWFGNTKTDKAEAPQKAATVYDIIRTRNDLSKFSDMISSADLKSLFTYTDQPLTVFAPTDDAINAIPSATMKRIKSSKENLQSFVKYHVIVGSRIGTNAIGGRKSSVAAANGESITFDGTSKTEAAKINDGHLVAGDLQAGSSVVHIISAALIPASLKDAPKDTMPEPAPAQSPAPVVPVPPVASIVTPPKTIAIGSSAVSVGPTSLGSEATTTSSVSGSKATKGLAIGTSASIGTSVPLGTMVLSPISTVAPAATPVVPPAVPAAGTDTQKAKGFEFFGHHFGG